MNSSIREVGQTTLLGTVHASRNSRDEVQEEITSRTPDVVAVELNPPRLHAMQESETASADPIDLTLSVMNGDLSLPGAIVNYLFVRQQSKVFSALNLRPGEADMLPAIESALESGGRAALVDSEISGAMNGLGTSLAPRELLSHVITSDIRSLLSSYSSLKTITTRNGFVESDSFEEAVQKLETMPYEDLELLLDAYETLLPEGTLDGLIKNRNEVMAGHLYWLQEHDHSVIAVMGRMHVPGVQSYLENPTRIPDECIVEPPYVTGADA